LTDQNDNHRTGCGCEQCGPPRRDPVTFDYVEGGNLSAARKLERIDELVRRYETGDPYNGVATLRAIREVLRG
jgi:hypothetical protein